MKQTGPQNPYESYCYTCNVTAPVDARMCVHCGGRLAKQRGAAPPSAPPPFTGGAPEADEADAPPRLAASPMTVVWVLLIVVGTFYRICT